MNWKAVACQWPVHSAWQPAKLSSSEIDLDPVAVAVAGVRVAVERRVVALERESC